MVLDITAIDELRGITHGDSGITIGALCSWSDIVNADLPAACKALQLAALEVGSVQIQNRATVAGNLCNASPAADGVPPLLIVDAMVNLSSASGTRTMPLAEFVQGNRRTQKNADELLTSVFIPSASCQGQSDFLKLGARRYLVISIAMVATRLEIEGGRFKNVAVAVGSCSETATRLAAFEQALTGKPATAESVDETLPSQFNELSPIDDVRGSAGYRLESATVLVKRSLQRCMAGEMAA